MRVMVLTPYLPHREVGHGGGSAVRDLVRHLAPDHEVLVASMVRPEEKCWVPEVEALGVAVASLPFTDRTARGLARIKLAETRLISAWRSLHTGFPQYVEKYWSLALRARILKLIEEFRPDAVQIEYLQLALYARDIRYLRESRRHSSPRIILNSHELGSVPRLRQARRTRGFLHRRYLLAEAGRWQRLQKDACSWADRVLCVTDEDRRVYEKQGGHHLLTVPLGMDLAAVRPDRAPEGESALFVGSFGHRPNVLAARMLVREIWPRVRAARPEARLTLVGRGSQEFLSGESDTSGIQALGFVDDLSGEFRRHRLFVAPLPEGGGIKIKILEAMARGIPLVTTPVGIEGITDSGDGTAIIVPAEGAAFAEAVLLALDDPQAEERALRARKLMEERFGWDAIAHRLAGIYRGEE